MIATPSIRTRTQLIQYKMVAVANRNLTPVSNPKGLLFACVEHARDDHKGRHDRALAYREKYPTDDQLSEILRCRVTEKCNAPDKYIEAETTRQSFA